MKPRSIIIEDKIRRQFNKGCVDYGLLSDGDRILVGLSGGKDSLELLRLLSERSRIFKPRIEVAAAHVIMDNIPYESDGSYLQQFADDCGVRLHLLHSSFDESTDERKTKCFLCSWNRRKTLFEFAEHEGYNKVALGHHQDDILVTLLMNMFFEGAFSAMPPMLNMDHYNISIIRPMCLVRESLVKELADELGFRKQKSLCPYEIASKRAEVTDLFRRIEAMSDEARFNLWKSMQNIRENHLPRPCTSRRT